MNPQEKELIVRLGVGEINSANFLSKFGKNPIEYIQDQLILLQKDKCQENLECILILVDSYGVTKDFKLLLLALLKDSWHIMHENILASLEQDLVHDDLDEIEVAITQDFNLYYDNGDSFIRKVLYLISRLDGSARIMSLCDSDNPIVSKYADHITEKYKRN